MIDLSFIQIASYIVAVLYNVVIAIANRLCR